VNAIQLKGETPMSATGNLQVTTPSDLEIVMTRVFNAPRHLVFDALTKPELLKRWMLGPPGWTMPVCEIDLRVGGAYRYAWRREETGEDMGMGGVFREIEQPARFVATERFDQAWYPGEALVTQELEEERGRTTLTATMLYESKEARDAAAATGMTDGVEMSYQRLDEVLGTLVAEGARATA
jgi:uncharacterized protein YndB with AHSA1/START domain